MSRPPTVRGIHKSCSGPYPGYDEQGTYTEPLRNGRVRPEAMENAQRHQGSLNLFGPNPYIIQYPSAKSRCPTEISQNNMEYSRKGTVYNIINGQASHRPDTPAHNRVRPEASEIAENHQGKSMADILYDQNPSDSLNRNSTKFVQEESRNFNGNQSLSLLHHSADNAASYRPAPRIKPEAHTNAQGATGKQMAAVFGAINEDELDVKRSLAPKPDRSTFSIFGTESVNAGGNSSQMKQLLNTNNIQPPLPAPAPRVKSEGEHMSKMDQGVRMNKLIHNPSSVPSPARPHNRNGVSLTAKQIALRNQGTVGNLLTNIGNKHIVETPGMRR